MLCVASRLPSGKCCFTAVIIVFFLLNFIFLTFLSLYLSRLSRVVVLTPKYVSAGESMTKGRRSKSSSVCETLLQLYFYLTEMMSLMAELVSLQEMTDSIVLQVSQIMHNSDQLHCLTGKSNTA